MRLELPACECTASSERCSVCCQFDGMCVPTSQLVREPNLTLVGLLLQLFI